MSHKEHTKIRTLQRLNTTALHDPLRHMRFTLPPQNTLSICAWIPFHLTPICANPSHAEDITNDVFLGCQTYSTWRSVACAQYNATSRCPRRFDFPGSDSKAFGCLDISERNMILFNRPPHYRHLIPRRLPITTRCIKDGNLCHMSLVAPHPCCVGECLKIASEPIYNKNEREIYWTNK